MTRRRLKPDERRAEIVEAAFRSFATQPYSDVSMAQIAKEAGASRALLTHYFGDKESLYAAVVNFLIEQLESIVPQDQGLSGRELIDSNLNAILDLLIAHKEATLAFLNAGPVGPDVVIAGAVQDFQSRVVNSVLSNHFGDAEVPPGRRLAVLGVVGFGNAAIFDWIRNESISRAELHEMVASSLERALAWDGIA